MKALTLTLATLLLLVVALLGITNSQTLDWLNEISKGPNFQIIRPSFIRNDNSGNIYVVSLQTVTSPGGTAGFAQILKYDSTGALLWTAATPADTINPVGWFDVAPDGTSFITGSNLVTGPGSFSNGFVQKYDASGAVQWIHVFPDSVMGRAIPLSGGQVRVEVRALSGLGPNFANTYDAAGTLLSTVPMANVIASTGPLDPVVASQSNSAGNFCGVLPTGGSGNPFNLVQLDAGGDIVWMNPISGIFFGSAIGQVQIDQAGNCVFVGSGSNISIPPLHFPANELRTGFLAMINSAGVPQVLKVYDMRSVDSIDCGGLPTDFSRCWISGENIDNAPVLARLNTNFDINDLFFGTNIETTFSFKIVFSSIAGRLAGAFSTGAVENGQWFNRPIQVPSAGNLFPGAMFAFQLNLANTQCNSAQLCAPGENCCALSNGQTSCFTPSLFSCFTQVGKLCPASTLPCGQDCYQINQYSCSNNQLCPVGTLHCGKQCYSPQQYSCFEGNVLCPSGTLLCGSACYSPTEFGCCNGQLCPPSST